MATPAGRRAAGRYRPASIVDHTNVDLDVSAAVAELLAGLVAEPWGQVTPSVYETGRVVSLLPWLAGQPGRVRYLLASQRPDDAWGGPDGYALVPTLSAVEALLALLARADPAECGPIDPGTISTAADRGLRAIWRLLDNRSNIVLPDTPAVEIVVPALVATLNDHLVRLRRTAEPGLATWRSDITLPLPAGVDPAMVRRIRARLDEGGTVPAKLLHSLEIFGSTGPVRPVPPGTIGASPAATASWLARRTPVGSGDPARRYLEAVAARHGGPVPSVVPITMFERAWVLSGLSGAGIAAVVPEPLLTSLAEGLDADGVPGGAGLPADADTTSVVLLTLAQLGRPVDLDCLWAYRADGHFQTWPGERTASATTNAHVLEAFGHRISSGGPGHARYAGTAAKLVDWLAGQQHPDGYWTDKWHASPWYATACCALALHRYGGERGAVAVRRAVAWVLSTQDDTGGWGRWAGTAEESAYGLQILLIAGRPDQPGVSRAVRRGYRFLRDYRDAPDPPLWHDKDLFRPVAVVRAAILTALHLAQRAGCSDGMIAGR